MPAAACLLVIHHTEPTAVIKQRNGLVIERTLSHSSEEDGMRRELLFFNNLAIECRERSRQSRHTGLVLDPAKAFDLESIFAFEICHSSEYAGDLRPLSTNSTS